MMLECLETVALTPLTTAFTLPANDSPPEQKRWRLAEKLSAQVG
jgi:hypothetical protein